MNIIEAIKSGKRYRLRGKLGWYDPDYEYDFSLRDVLDNDWETEPVYVTITREQFNAAWDNALLMIGIRRHRDALAKELGL